MSACALCGTAARPPFRAPAPEGSPDLDGRPGEPTRSTLRRWLQCCSGCAAYAPDLSALPPSSKHVPATQAYRALTSPFLRWASLVAGQPEEAEALLQAAWNVEDDDGDGTVLRQRAAAAWLAPANTEAVLRLADTQRRAGLMADATLSLDTLPITLDESTARIAAFERARIAAQDTGRHLLSSALRPPARTPHVAHGKRKPGGFWSRLLGGAA